MLLLDTRDIPRADRAEAFAAAMHEVSSPCRIEQREPQDELQVHMQLWPYGQAALLSTDASRLRLTRTRQHIGADGGPVVGVSFQAAGRGEFAQLGHEQVVRDDEVMLVDMGTPYSFGCATGGGAQVFLVPYELLALPEDVVRRAMPRLRASPLHDLVHAHLSRLASSAPQLAADPGAAALGTATVELVRALIVSAAGDAVRSAPVREQTLVTRVRAYVGQRLHDPELTPAAIAGAHNVSLRQLYKACNEAGLRLEQWIIEQRLEAARAHLATPAGLRRSIAATARAHGFADPSHFTRRFRQAYGMTPREWQRAATAA
ncbi:helix-turn-helix domain-containing protein [Modestobacter marinus]|uniref:helix-turn-helix domain-containing protein n=1 Tax=Modestobacter marinus TaxID=477641 RepID=UPI001C96A52C|nr:helix-turn-helix domain-containing protein [Modestobacter marinus]